MSGTEVQTNEEYLTSSNCQKVFTIFLPLESQTAANENFKDQWIQFFISVNLVLTGGGGEHFEM